jgi:hypothetical protein
LRTKFYCEKHIPGVYTAFDVQYTNDLIDLFEAHNLLWENSDPRSMLIVYDMKTTLRGGPIEGNWYSIPNDFWDQFTFIIVPYSDDQAVLQSLIFRAVVSANSIFKLVNFSSYRTIGPEIAELDKLLYLSPIQPKHSQLMVESFPTETDELELFVRDVECGNWNEIRHIDSGFRLIYDMGSDLTWTGAQIIDVIQEAEINNSFHVIISHWDLDHVQSILGMFDYEIRNIISYTAPSKNSNYKYN